MTFITYPLLLFFTPGLRPFTRVTDFSFNPEPNFVLKTNLEFTPGWIFSSLQLQNGDHWAASVLDWSTSVR